MDSLLLFFNTKDLPKIILGYAGPLFSQLELDTLEELENQCILAARTYDSLHSLSSNFSVYFARCSEVRNDYNKAFNQYEAFRIMTDQKRQKEHDKYCPIEATERNVYA